MCEGEVADLNLVIRVARNFTRKKYMTFQWALSRIFLFLTHSFYIFTHGCLNRQWKDLFSLAPSTDGSNNACANRL
jgi:hypothetical protein